MDENISEMDVVFAKKEATLDPEIVRDAARRTRQRLMKRKLKLVTSQERCLYFVGPWANKGGSTPPAP